MVQSHCETLLLMLVLPIVAGPLFVCLPVNSGTVLFDLQVEGVTHNGILQRDVIEPNLSGAVWLHQQWRRTPLLDMMFIWNTE